MGRHTKFLNKVKTALGKQSPHAGHPPENNVGPKVLIAPRPHPASGILQSRPDSHGEGNRRGIQVAVDERPGGDDNGAKPSHNRHAAGNDEDLVPLGPPPIRQFPAETPAFRDIKNSGISYGGGAVNVMNEFHTHNHTPSERIRPGFKLLQKHVATSAFHNSAQRLDPPRCHPDTRVAIQNQIYDWILMDLLIRQVWIMWMHGAAGAGKSAIMQSIAELCEKAQIPLASFFFFRTDPTRNSTASFIATLVYQLLQLIPQVQDEIFGIIENNPLIFAQSLKSQIEQLIIRPLLRVRKHFKGFFVVLIDGLDECTERAHQIDLLQSLAAVSHCRTIPVVFLVASRREPQIEAAFTRDEVSDLTLILSLDNSDIEQTADDIRRFLVDKFRAIKKTHLLKRYLPIDWPPASSIEAIVTKSSGQFIFASVVINYLSSPRGNPAHQLEVIHGIRLRDPSSQNPFAHLDALYQHIFSQVEVLDKVLEIIAFVITSDMVYIEVIDNAFLLEPGELYVLFADLTAVIFCEPPTHDYPSLKFLHASLPDFLIDKTRSEQYHINLDEYRAKLLCRFLERCPPILDPLWLDNDLEAVINREHDRLAVILKLLKEAKATERLHSALMNFNYTLYSQIFFNRSNGHGLCSNILQTLKHLDFCDQRKAYYHVVDMLAAEYAKYWHSVADYVKESVEEYSPDLAVRIERILEQVTTGPVHRHKGLCGIFCI